MRVLRLLAAMTAISIQRQVAYGTNLAFEVLLAAMGLVASVAALSAVFTYTPTLAGWSSTEVIVLLGCYHMVTGVLQAFVEPNLAFFVVRVLRGELDDTLLQPVPGLVVATLGTCRPLALSQAVLGVVTVLVGLTSAGASVTPAGVLAWLVLLAAGVVVAWSSRTLLASLAFWTPGFDPTVMYSGFWQLGQYPVDIYPGVVRPLLTYVVPVAFIATMPARALTHGADPLLLVGGPGAAVGLIWLVRVVWQAGLRRYTSATA